MMKHVLWALTVLTCDILLHAQPVITRNELMFPGDMVRAVLASQTPPPGPAGAMVHWDFSGVQEGTGGSRLNVVAAQTTPYINQYPQSNIAFVDASLTPQYFQYNAINAVIWEDHGHVVPGFYVLQYTDPRLVMPFPCTFGTQWQDDFTYTIDYQLDPPITTVGDGALQGTADGYGALSLPQGTFNETLRLRTVSLSTDMTELGAGLYETNTIYDTTYTWLSPDHHAPLCTYAKSVIFRQTMTTSDTLEEIFQFVAFTFDNTAEPTSASRDLVTPGQYALQVSPNPFSQHIDLSFKISRAQEINIRVFDLMGIVVYTDVLFAMQGQHTHQCLLPALSPGTYILTLQSDEGIDMQKITCIGGTR